ncbi:MAG TPA: hypothetical protein DCQ31_18280 [Bacteroidales bacterium]|nr:hypothetical protein [Bacteroidales bacterium]
MKKIFIFALLAVIANSIVAQDLIITSEGDSINCKITKVKNDFVYFTFKHNDQIRSTLLPKINVKAHIFNYYQTGEVPKEKVIGFENYKHFRFAVNGGYSYLTAKVAESVPADFKNYVNDLKSGYNFGSDLTYYFTEPLGVGVKYYVLKSSNSLDDIYLQYNNGNVAYGKMSDDLTISFIGPMFSTRLLNKNKSNAFIMNLSLGYIDYSNNKTLIDKYKMSSGTMGLSYDIGYDIGLTENLLLGFQISFITATLTEYDWFDGTTTETIKLEKGQFESLNRIDFSIGIRLIK